MLHFVVKFSKFSSPQAARGIDPLTKILRTFLQTRLFLLLSNVAVSVLYMQICGLSDVYVTKSEANMERKCADNYNKRHNIFFLKQQSASWQFQTITFSECCSVKLRPYILFEKSTYILALEMAGPGNRGTVCACCISARSFPTEYFRCPGNSHRMTTVVYFRPVL